MTVRRFSPEEERMIALAYLSCVRMVDLCREHQVSSPAVYGWRDRFPEAA
jgi:transposase-like protein